MSESHYLGIDLGGTKVSAAIFNDSGNIERQEYFLLEGRGGSDVGELIVSLCDSLCQEAGLSKRDIKGIGVCVPGIAYSTTGNVWAPNIPGWENYPLRRELSEAFPDSVVSIESDRTCYIVGEEKTGNAKGCKNAIFIAVGTGIGAGIMIDGMVLHGVSDIVGAIGWMALKPPYTDEWDACGCFETHASGEGIAKQARAIVESEPGYQGELKQCPPDQITSYKVFEAYAKNDPVASKVIDIAVEMWGMAAANLVSLFNPELIIFGGGVFGPAIPLIDRIYNEAKKWAQPISINQVRFIPTALPKEAGLYGAGALAIRAATENN